MKRIYDEQGRQIIPPMGPFVGKIIIAFIIALTLLNIILMFK